MVLFFISLGARDLWNPNEAIYGQAVVEMDARGDWVVPTVNEKHFAEKPILYYWGALLSARLLGGVDELTLRVPSALAGLLSVWLIYLLVVPYAGRQRAQLAALLLATQYQVLWAARSVQMDILVLVSVLGILLPLSRMLDFGASPDKAWALAGLAAGLGFLAKGPVTLVLAGLVFVGYSLMQGKIAALATRAFAQGALVAVVVASPWLLMLWVQGQHEFLYELLIRQNFTRFTDPWHHHRPWWYYLQYFWIDFAPWSWLVPAAIRSAPRDRAEKKLHDLGWIWLFAILVFFSLSSGKRSPYMLPAAPAVAILASGVVQRLISGDLSRSRRRFSLGVITLFGILFMTAGLLLLTQGPARYPDLATAARGLAVILGGGGLGMFAGVAVYRRSRVAAPAALFAGLLALYLTTAIWTLPAVNPMKSARGFTAELNARLQQTGGEVVSYGFWDWRAGYPYYARRTIPNLESPAELVTFWQTAKVPFVIVEEGNLELAQDLLADATLVQHQKIGSRTAYLFTKP